MTRHRPNRAPVEEAVTASNTVEEFFRRFTAEFQSHFTSQQVQRQLKIFMREKYRKNDEFRGFLSRWFQGRIWGIIGTLLHGDELRELLVSMDPDNQDRVISQIWDFAAQITALEFGIEPSAPLTHCKYHGHTPSLGRARCPQCPCEIPVRYDEGWESLHCSTFSSGPAVYPTYRGRRPKYCSRACRQRAYRRRKALTGPKPP